MWCSARDGPLCTYYNLNIPRGRSIQAALTCVHPNVPAPPPVPVHTMCRVTYLLNWYLAQGRPGSNELLTNRIIEINEPALWLDWPMCQVSHSLSLSVIKSPFSWQGWLLAPAIERWQVWRCCSVLSSPHINREIQTKTRKYDANRYLSADLFTHWHHCKILNSISSPQLAFFRVPPILEN